MNNGNKTSKEVKTYRVYEYLPSGKSHPVSGDYKSLEKAKERMFALQESNNNKALYEGATTNDYIICSHTRRIFA